MSRPILHLEVPRALTFTLREPHTDCVARFGLPTDASGYEQRDLNPAFWRWALAAAPGLYEALADRDGATPITLDAVERGLDALAARSDGCELFLDYGGIGTPADFVPAASWLCRYLERSDDFAFFEGVIEALVGDVDFDRYAFVSLGVQSVAELMFAAFLANHVRCTAPGVLVVLGHHHAENFTLRHRIDDLIANEALFTLFDGVTLVEERIADAFAGLLRFVDARDESGLTNLALRTDVDGRVRVFHAAFPSGPVAAERAVDPDYVLRSVEEPGDAVVQFRLARNRCYYARCTFCVQIEKHLTDAYYDADREVDGAIALVRDYAAIGVRWFNVADEAIRPAHARAFAQALLEAKQEVEWCGRIIADQQFDAATVEQLAGAGCREILVGLETVCADTARAMGKVTMTDPEPQIRALLDRFAESRIDVVLSMIRAFPTESDEQFEITRRFWRDASSRYDNLLWIWNRFELFHGSAMHREPERHGVVAVSAPEPRYDLELVVGYEDVHGRTACADPDATAWLGATLGLTAEQVEAIDPAVLAAVFRIGYGSTGLRYRSRTGRFLWRDVLA